MTPFRTKPSLVATPISERFFPDEGPLVETLIFIEISYGSYQPFNFLYYDLGLINLFYDYIKFKITVLDFLSNFLTILNLT